MPLSPDDLRRLRAEARLDRPLSQAEEMRGALAPYVDTGMLSDAEVRLAYAILIEGDDADV